MWKSKAILAGFVVAATVCAVVYAQQSGGGSLTAEDHTEIQRLYVRFNWALDTQADNGMAYAKMFATDGEFVYGDNRIGGHDRLAQLAVQSAQGDNAPHHYTTNIIVVPSPGGARGSAYLFGPSGGPGGTYDDVLVKTADGWRFKRRELFQGKLTPTAADLLASE